MCPLSSTIPPSENKSPTIYVTTPCLQAAETIDATIAGIVNQKGKFRLRYHVQDGGSTDGCVEKLRAWEHRLASREAGTGCLGVIFTWDSAPDAGMYAAIEKGFLRLAPAANAFMTWLNADDLLLPGALERVAGVAASRPDIDWITGARHLVDEQGRTIEHDAATTFPREMIAQGLCDGIHWQFVQQEGSFWRSSLYAAAGRLDTTFRRAGDWDLWRRMAVHAPLYALPVATGAFRRRPGQLSADTAAYLAEVDAKVPRPVRARMARLLKRKIAELETPRLADPLAEAPQKAAPAAGPSSARSKAEAWRKAHFPDKDWPRISIVTPSFNQGAYLDACMRSILGQGYPNLEYIVLDGGSTDNSVQVIQSHASELAYWRSRPDKGQYAAVEEGLNRATGEIMAWLNADDLYLGCCLFKVAMLFLAHPKLEWLCGRPMVVNAEGKTTFRQEDIAWSRAELLSAENPVQERFLGQDAVFWRKSLWERSGKRLDKRFTVAADYELWVRFARFAPLHSVRDELSAFRYHGDQRSLTDRAKYIQEMADIIQAELDRLAAEGLPSGFGTPPNFLEQPYSDLFPTAGPRPVRALVQHVDLPLLRKNLHTLHMLASKPEYLDQSYKEDILTQIFSCIGQQRGIRCICFDCFDTLLYRLSDEPAKLFFEVGTRLKEKNILAAHISAAEFYSLRQHAEQRARKLSSKMRKTSECSIEEIYTCFEKLITNANEAASVEIETEEDFCYLNRNIASLIYKLKSESKRIAILSDTYLSGRQLASILAHSGFDMQVPDALLTSRDIGAGKAEGGLFRAALARLNLSPSQAVHIGDNITVDINGAAKAGIQAFCYPRRDAYTQEVTLRERNLISTRLQAASLGSFRVLACRSGAAFDEPMRGYFRDGAFLFGPPLARFADWVVQQCRNEGIHRALVFMREAYTLLPLVRNSARAAGYALDLIPFYVSRYSVNLASLTECTPQALYEKSFNHREIPIHVLLHTFGLDPTKIKEIRPELLNVTPDTSDRFRLMEFLSGHATYRRLIEAQAKQARQCFLGYALPLLKGEERVAVVDIGFRGMVQRNMDTILEQGNTDIRTLGLYFCTQPTAAENVLEGSDIRSYLGSLGAEQEEFQVVVTHPEILEQAVNSPCGTTLGYAPDEQGEYKPILEQRPLPAEQIFKRYAIRKGILEFQIKWLDFAKPKLCNAEAAFVKRILSQIDAELPAIVRRLWSFPLKEEAERLGSLYHDENNGTETGDIICNAKTRALYRQKGMAGLGDNLAYWPQGVIALESPNMAANLLALELRLKRP